MTKITDLKAWTLRREMQANHAERQRLRAQLVALVDSGDPDCAVIEMIRAVAMVSFAIGIPLDELLDQLRGEYTTL